MHGLKTIKRMNNWRYDSPEYNPIVGDEHYPSTAKEIMAAPTPRIQYTVKETYVVYQDGEKIAEISGMTKKEFHNYLQQMEDRLHDEEDKPGTDRGTHRCQCGNRMGNR